MSLSIEKSIKQSTPTTRFTIIYGAALEGHNLLGDVNSPFEPFIRPVRVFKFHSPVTSRQLVS